MTRLLLDSKYIFHQSSAICLVAVILMISTCDLIGKHSVLIDDDPPSNEKPSEEYNPDSIRDTLQVMSFNIRGDQPVDGKNQWEYRKDKVIKLIKEYSPGFLNLQEAKLKQLKDIEEQLSDYRTIGGGQRAGEYTIIVYNYRKVKLVQGSETIIWLSETPNKQSIGWDAKFSRILIYVTFKNLETGKDFLVLDTHFDHIGDRAREESARLIVSTIQNFKNANEPIILMGDFNCTEDSSPYRILTGSYLGLKDSYYESNTPHIGPDAQSSGFSVAEHSDRKPIDFIFVNNKVEVLKHAFLTESTNGYYPSDHLPVLAEIKLN